MIFENIFLKLAVITLLLYPLSKTIKEIYYWKPDRPIDFPSSTVLKLAWPSFFIGAITSTIFMKWFSLNLAVGVGTAYIVTVLTLGTLIQIRCYKDVQKWKMENSHF